MHFATVKFAWKFKVGSRFLIFHGVSEGQDLKPLIPNPTQSGQTHSTIRRLLPTNCLRVFDRFMGLGLKG